jgi:hypothetical protein
MRRLTTATAALAFASTGLVAEPMQTFGGGLSIADALAGLNIDVNADGVFDLRFAYYGTSVNSIFGWDAVVREASDTAEVRFASSLDANDRVVHPRFAPGVSIGPASVDGAFDFGAAAYENYFDGFSGGDWLDQEPGFVGFSFLATDGGRHFGWAEIALDNENDPGEGFLVLTRIAYETDAGVPIAAGDAGAQGCNAADLAEPFDVLDLDDITEMITQKLAGTLDLDGNGVCDLGDINVFVTQFLAGCP